MPSITTFTQVENQLVSVLAAVSITIYPYEIVELDSMPAGTLFPRGVGIGYQDFDQAYGMGAVEWWLRYYVSLEQPPDQALTSMKTSLATIWATLGTNRTLDGKCRDSHLGDFELEPVIVKGRVELMAEGTFTAVLHPNIGNNA